ncbi:hypothetical protein L9F63_013063, partial [Diploptera punctata]
DELYCIFCETWMNKSCEDPFNQIKRYSSVCNEEKAGYGIKAYTWSQEDIFSRKNISKQNKTTTLPPITNTTSNYTTSNSTTSNYTTSNYTTSNSTTSNSTTSNSTTSNYTTSNYTTENTTQNETYFNMNDPSNVSAIYSETILTTSEAIKGTRFRRYDYGYGLFNYGTDIEYEEQSVMRDAATLMNTTINITVPPTEITRIQTTTETYDGYAPKETRKYKCFKKILIPTFEGKCN